MNVLLGPIVYIMNEPESFFCFQKLLDLVPTYIKPDLSGPLKGCALIDKIIERVDPKLFAKLKS